MGERFEAALQAALADLTAMDEVRALLFFGTAAAGQAEANSDLDLYVILRDESDWAQTTVRRYLGVEAEVHFAPARWWQQRLENRAPIALSAFATGRLVCGEAGALVALARRLWEAGPAPLGQPEVDRLRYHLTDLAGDLADVAERYRQRYLGALLVDQALEGYCRIHRLWGEKPKRRLAYLERHDPELGRLARGFFELGEPGLAQAVVDRVLAPVGGRLVSYEGERRPVGPSGPSPDQAPGT